MKEAKGDILAFLDDDAFPRKDWLMNALKDFAEADVAAVGGPAVTPAEDSLRQKASGAVFSSYLVSAKFIYRYLPRKKRVVDDFPSCNFLVRRKIMEEL
ncbi:MAG: glycosyltransferase, partial [Candidatus Omnitrophica bacterium]|nr:glycosyltransferase [Candidatus Omnitrophota bacterium]